jgi:hypothetical protein
LKLHRLAAHSLRRERRLVFFVVEIFPAIERFVKDFAAFRVGDAVENDLQRSAVMLD